ncbi:hypothetical protein ANCCAN_23530 [Ancylostoma caninum]|uniref:Uncharacterized protein n=1 Tax=Ancylostoma caninum TaxID=29170 RepID=A0A368FII9_ANCCA|nr:hypothetical protein ANCCAN_23530 [Ancylostoma caninum]
MSLRTVLIVCVIHLLVIACSASSAKDALDSTIPQCRELGRKALTKTVRKLLYIDILNSKRQEYGPTYTCEMEKRAHEFVKTSSPGPAPETKDVLYSKGEKLNLNEIRKEWKEELEKVRAHLCLA